MSLDQPSICHTRRVGSLRKFWSSSTQTQRERAQEPFRSIGAKAGTAAITGGVADALPHIEGWVGRLT
jgi:hypothetical protein